MCILVVGTSQVKATVVPQDLTATMSNNTTVLLIIKCVTTANTAIILFTAGDLQEDRILDVQLLIDLPKTSVISKCVSIHTY